MLNPRAYDGAVSEMISGTDNFVFRQNTILMVTILRLRDGGAELRLPDPNE